jgi:hypothetical protein
MKILNVVESAYRATLEEQDDTILWLSRALQNNGADLTLLLRGNAVNYAVRQECPPLSFGGAGVNHPARPNEDLAKLREKGARVLAVREDIEERGISRESCVAEVELISRGDIAGLMESHEQVWHW